MTLYVTLLHVIALLAVTGFTLGNGDDEVTSKRVCTMRGDEDKRILLFELAIGCVVRNGTDIEELRKTKTLEDRRAFFTNICDKSQEITECLSGVAQQSEICQGQTHHNNLKLFVNLLETTLYSGCTLDGEAIDSLVTIFINSSSSPFETDPFRNCVMMGTGKNAMIMHQDIELSSRFFILYQEAVNIRECFGDIKGEDRRVLNMASNMNAVISDIVSKMQCIHPHDGTLVRCTTIDITLPDTPRICPIKSDNEKRSPMIDLLDARLSWCLDSSYYLEAEGLNEIENLNMSRAFLKHSCSKKRILARCWSDVVAISSVCLNETQHTTIKIVKDVLQNALDYGCIDDGQYLANVLYKVVSDMKTTPNQNVVKECVGLARRAQEEGSTQFNAASMLVYHQQLTVFKECLISKLRGDNRAVFNADTFLTLVQRSMKCLDPVDGIIVLCETIDPTPSTAVKVCPFVDENIDEPSMHKTFVDMGFSCVHSWDSTLDFALVDGFTTLEEFQTFFNLYCHHRLPIKQCIDQLSSNSAVCQNQTNHQMWNIFADFLETTIETGCRQDGAALATIMHGFQSNAESGVESDQVKVCLDTAGNELRIAILSSDSTSAKSMLAYRTLESLKACFVNADYEMGSFKNVFVTFMNDILRSFKCVHPDDGTTVLCETIVNN